MDIIEEQVMWFPGIYGGRTTEEYTQNIARLTLDQVIELVTKRVDEDGEWLIANGHVGKDNKNEPKMRAMMEFAKHPKHIEQVIDYIYKEQTEVERSVDHVCRELANASKWAVGTQERLRRATE